MGPEGQVEISQGHERCRLCGKSFRCREVAVRASQVPSGRSSIPLLGKGLGLTVQGGGSESKELEKWAGRMKEWGEWKHPSDHFQFIILFFRLGENLAAAGSISIALI